VEQPTTGARLPTEPNLAGVQQEWAVLRRRAKDPPGAPEPVRRTAPGTRPVHSH
jgi:hypothetical protein